jgi:hypothetical protein
MEVSCSDNIDSMYVGIRTGEDSIYTLTFGAIRGNIYLKDTENDSTFQMIEGEQYHFSAAPNSKNDLRFQILLTNGFDNWFPNLDAGDVVTNVDDIPTTKIWAHDNIIYISNAPTNSHAMLFNIGGQLLLTTPIHTSHTLNLSHMPKGMYMLKLNNQVYKFVCK